MKTNKLKSLICAAAVLSAIGSISLAHAGAITVNFEVNGDQTKLIPTTRGTCVNNNAPGCIQASGQVQINFVLSGPETCSFDHVALGSPGNISAVAAADFNADMSSGYVTPIAKSDRHILIRDNNTEAYSVNYTVYAQCYNGVIDSDPRVVNDGSGHQ